MAKLALRRYASDDNDDKIAYTNNTMLVTKRQWATDRAAGRIHVATVVTVSLLEDAGTEWNVVLVNN